MADVILVISADNTNAVRGIKEVQKETQKLADMGDTSSKKRLGFIEQEEKRIAHLTELRRKSYDTKNIEFYNKTIKDSQDRLKGLESAGIGVEKSTSNMGVMFGKLFAVIGGGAAVMKVFHSIMQSTEATTHELEKVTTGLTSGIGFFFKAIASGDWTNFRQGLRDAIEGGVEFVNEMENIQNRQNEQVVLSAEASAKIAELRMGTFDKGIENVDKLIENTGKIIEIQKGDFEKQSILAKDLYETNLKKAATDSKISKERLQTLVTEYSLNKANIELGDKWKTDFAVMRKAVDDATTQEQKDAASNLVLKAKFYSDMATEWGRVPAETRKTLAQLKASQIQLEGQAKIGSRRDENLLAAALNRKESDEKTSLKKISDDKLKQQEDYNKAVLALSDDLDKSEIESLTGVEKLKAQRDFGIKQIKVMRDNLDKLGPITDEQYSQLQQLADNVWKAFYDELKKIVKIEAPQSVIIDVEIKTQKDVLKDLKKQLAAIPVVEGKIDLNAEKIKVEIKEIEDKLKSLGKEKVEITIKIKKDISEALLEDVPPLEGLQKSTLSELDKRQVKVAGEQKEPVSVWSLLGIDPDTDEGKKAIENLQTVADETTRILDESFQHRVDDAQRKRELLDTQISETESALNTEVELQQAGYASNVDAKKKELETLKKQRDIAIKDEEAAIKKQRQMDAITQGISLVTAAANIIKGFSKIPIVGVILGIAAVAAMFAAFVAARTKASSVSQLKQGGRGEISGRSHDQGGEMFTDQIEVEREEKWGVLSRPASKKYGKAFYQMVDGFNKDDKFIINKAISILNPDYAGGMTTENYNKEITNNIVNNSLIEKSENIQKEINNLKTEIDNSKSKTEIRTINNQISKLKTELTEVTNKIENHNNLINKSETIQNKITNLKNQITNSNSQTINNQIEKLKTELSEITNKTENNISNISTNVFNANKEKTIRRHDTFNTNTEKLSFVKISPDIIKNIILNDVNNNIKIDNIDSNKRLDKIHSELQLTNKKPVKEEIIELIDQTIIRRGHSTRIIKR